MLKRLTSALSTYIKSAQGYCQQRSIVVHCMDTRTRRPRRLPEQSLMQRTYLSQMKQRLKFTREVPTNRLVVCFLRSVFWVVATGCPATGKGSPAPLLPCAGSNGSDVILQNGTNMPSIPFTIPIHNHVSFTRRIPSCLEVHRRKRLDIRNTDVHLLRYVWLATAASPHGQAEMQVRG